MNAATLVIEAARAGVFLRREGSTVKVRGTPSPALLEKLRSHKADILVILAAETCRRCGTRPQPLELGGFSLGGWSCDACLAAASLLALARGAVVKVDADDPILRRANSARRWHDDRAWIGDIAGAQTTDEKLAVLGAWVAAAGGRLVSTTAELPRLPARLAALELRRMLRQAGIEVREGAGTAGTTP